MRKTTKSWTVEILERHHARIEFPEYQREPNVWSRAAKQRLIDSMLRQFDIASLYIYDNKDGSFDCIDGRQRIGAIMSFLGKNEADNDNDLALRMQNEVYTDTEIPFGALDGCGYKQIEEYAAGTGAKALEAQRLLDAFNNYQLTVVQLSDSKEPAEFNLQFTRLNLGTIINSGEKLHAMVGEMRDECFGPNGIGSHPFLQSIRIPTRRYSREQVAAQILAQRFAIAETGGFIRTRHFDLQRFFKECSELNPAQRQVVQAIRRTMDLLDSAFGDKKSVLSNRAMTVSTVLLAASLELRNDKAARSYAEFVDEFLCRLKWQVSKGLDVDNEYRYLIDFQRHVTQASVEKPALEARDATLKKEYLIWTKTHKLTGDAPYAAAGKGDPGVQCRAIPKQQHDD